MTLAIFGGTFDPLHNGHLAVAKAVQTALSPDNIVFVPVGNPPHKQQRYISDAEDRWQMVSLAVENIGGMSVSRVDIDRAGPQYSVDTVRLLQQEYSVGADETYFIIGADSLADILTWHQPQELVVSCRLVAVHRPGVQPAIETLTVALPQLSARLIWVEMSPIPISATDIRRRVGQGKSITQLVPPSVAEYIARHKLYARTNTPSQ